MIFSHLNVGSAQWPQHWAEGILPTTIKSHVVKIVITWSISPDKKNNIGLVYSFWNWGHGWWTPHCCCGNARPTKLTAHALLLLIWAICCHLEWLPFTWRVYCHPSTRQFRSQVSHGVSETFWERHFTLCLFQHRKTGKDPDITGKLLTGM